MKPLSEEVKLCRWKMIRHILRQGQSNHCNIAVTRPPERKRINVKNVTLYYISVELGLKMLLQNNLWAEEEPRVRFMCLHHPRSRW